MNEIPAQAAMGWGRSQSDARTHGRMRLRDVIPPLAAIGVLTLAHIAFGAVQPIASLPLAGLFTFIATAALAAAGPRHVTPGMMLGAAMIALVGITGLAGPLERSMPQLAILFAAGALWTIAYIAARHRRALDAAWRALIWGSVAYCTWLLVLETTLSPSSANSIADAFETPANGALLFGLFSLIAMGRILYVVKQMDAEALPRARMIDRLLRTGMGGILLLMLSLACLIMTGSRPGIILTLGVLCGHVWWDMLAIATRKHRGVAVRLAAVLAPVVALGLVAWGVALAWMNDETIVAGIGAADQLPNLQRIEAYMAAWMESPALGHGLGSIEAIGDRTTTLFNAKAMLAPGDAHNIVVTWLVELGVVGLALLVIVVGAIYARIFAALRSRQTPRTFLRLSVVAGALMLLHGIMDSSLDLPSAVWLYAFLLGGACGVATGTRLAPRAAPE